MGENFYKITVPMYFKVSKVNERPGKTEELYQTEGDKTDTTSKCNKRFGVYRTLLRRDWVA